MSTLLHYVIDVLMKEEQDEDPFVAVVRASGRPDREHEDAEQMVADSDYLRLREEFDRDDSRNLTLQRYASL